MPLRPNIEFWCFSDFYKRSAESLLIAAYKPVRGVLILGYNGSWAWAIRPGFGHLNSVQDEQWDQGSEADHFPIYAHRSKTRKP